MAEHEATTPPPGAVAIVPNVPGALQTVTVQDPLHYLKFIVPFLAAGIITFQAVYGHGNMLFVVLSIVVAIAQAIGTYFARNAASGFWSVAKFWVNVIGTIAQSVLAVVGAGGDVLDITPQQWAAIALAALSALGVLALPNTSATKIITTPAPVGSYSLDSWTPAATPAAPDPEPVPSTFTHPAGT